VELLRRESHEIHVVCHPDGGAPNEKDIVPVIDTDRHGWDEAVFEAVKPRPSAPLTQKETIFIIRT